MKEILLIICYIELSHESLLNSIKSSSFGTTTTSTNTPWPGKDIHPSTETSSSLPEVSLTSKTVKKFKSQNGYKNQRGYKLNEEFHNNGTKPSSEKPKTIPDSRFVYHSLTNPLFKSGTINLKSTENDDPLSKIKSDTTLHKISNPFDTKWLLVPGDRNDKLSPSKSDLNSVLGLSDIDSTLSTSADDYKFKPAGLAKKTLSLFGKNGEPALANKTSIVIPVPKLDLKEVDKKLNIFQAKSPILTSTTTTTTASPPASTEKTFYSYNVEEVKTSDGKTRGTVQIFDEKGLKKNLVYDEKGVLEDKTAGKKNETNKTGNTAANVTQIPLQLESVFSQSDFAPQPLLFQTADEIEYSRPFDTSGNSFATPEFILYDFLGRLGSTSPYVANNDNFITNEVGSLDEAVNENSFFYSVRK